MINMLKVLMIKGDNMQQQIGGNPEVEIQRWKSQERIKKKCQNSKIPIEMQNAFNGLISRLDTTEERINLLTEISKTKAKRKKMEKS